MSKLRQINAISIYMTSLIVNLFEVENKMTYKRKNLLISMVFSHTYFDEVKEWKSVEAKESKIMIRVTSYEIIVIYL